MNAKGSPQCAGRCNMQADQLESSDPKCSAASARRITLQIGKCSGPTRRILSSRRTEFAHGWRVITPPSSSAIELTFLEDGERTALFSNVEEGLRIEASLNLESVTGVAWGRVKAKIPFVKMDASVRASGEIGSIVLIERRGSTVRRLLRLCMLRISDRNDICQSLIKPKVGGKLLEHVASHSGNSELCLALILMRRISSLGLSWISLEEGAGGAAQMDFDTVAGQRGKRVAVQFDATRQIDDPQLSGGARHHAVSEARFLLGERGQLQSSPGKVEPATMIPVYPASGSVGERASRAGPAASSGTYGARLSSASEDPSPDAIVTFGIPLASRQSVADWDRTCHLLAQTLRSIHGQIDARYRVIVCGHERPDIPEINSRRVTFLSIQHRPPRRDEPSKFRGDKKRKRHVLGLQHRLFGGGLFMQLDADDLVHRDLVKFCADTQPQFGYVMSAGYMLDWVSKKIAPLPGVLSVDFDRVCGSCAVIRYQESDLPTVDISPDTPTLLFNMTRQHAYMKVVMEESGRSLQDMPFPAVVYVINHSQNLSFSMQKQDARGATLVERVAATALNPKWAIRVMEEFCQN